MKRPCLFPVGRTFLTRLRSSATSIEQQKDASKSAGADNSGSDPGCKSGEMTKKNEERAPPLFLQRENAFPTHFSKPRGPGRPTYSLVPGQSGELLADYVLFEESMNRAKVLWLCYNKMTADERKTYIQHMRAIRDRKLFYQCIFTGEQTSTVSRLLYEAKCCGNGCRHCPYELEGCDEHKRKSSVWNGAFYV